MRLSGADIVVRTLIEQGSDVVFGYPGGQIINVYDSLYKYSGEITHILTAHEQGAAHAADGYARATGKVGVVIATSGPGATNLVTGIATAHLDSVPIVAITGNVPSTQIGTDSFQEIDITGITLPITKHNFFVDDISFLADTIREAFRLAKSGRPGPVLVDVPKDVQTAYYDYEPIDPVNADEKFAAKQIRIDEAAECMNASNKPFIYFGGGLLSSDAADEMLMLAKKIDAAVGCSFMGISAIPTDQKRFLGMQGMFGHYAANMAMQHADCIIALGVRFNDRVTGDRKRFAGNASIVHIDIDGAELSKTVSTAHTLRGDIKKTLCKLLPLLESKSNPEWMREIEEYINKEAQIADKRSGMTPKNVLTILDRFLSPDMPVATDVGQHQMWAAQTLTFSKKRKFISSGGLGTMGFGMGAAIGAQIGANEHAVLVTGDGSFGMCLNELATAVTYRIPLVILIMNNSALGLVRQAQRLQFEKRYSCTELDRKTDFVKVAQAFGADGRRVTALDELENALNEAFLRETPYLIDCVIDRDELVLPIMSQDATADEIITKVGD